VDQGRQSRHLQGAPVLPPLPGQRGEATLERHSVQPREPPTSARSAGRHPELVTDEPTAADLQDRGRLIRHARYFILQPAGSHLTRRLFGRILRRAERSGLIGACTRSKSMRGIRWSVTDDHLAGPPAPADGEVWLRRQLAPLEPPGGASAGADASRASASSREGKREAR